MIDSAVVDMLDESWHDAVKKALATLARSGIYDLQVEVAKSQLAFGSVDESADHLAAQVLETRRKIQALTIMKELGNSYRSKENE
jgi:hypothetical protein